MVNWYTEREKKIVRENYQKDLWLNRIQQVKEELCRENPENRRRYLRKVAFKFFKPVFKNLQTKRAKRNLKWTDPENLYCGGMKGLVSVVIPVYNQSEFLDGGVRSVLGQGYKNVEIIIVNDGSTDGVEKVLRQYEELDNVMIISQKNRKLPTALNVGFSYARGEYLTWTSADNFMAPDQLFDQVKFLKKNIIAHMVFCNYEIIRGKEKYYDAVEGERIVDTDYDVGALNYTYNFINACFLYRRSIAKIIGPYDPMTFGAEDYDYWLRINTDFCIRHIGGKKSYYKYRLHENTILGREGEAKISGKVESSQKSDQERRTFFLKRTMIYMPELEYSDDLKENEIKKENIILDQYRNWQDLKSKLNSRKNMEKSIVFFTDKEIEKNGCSEFISDIKRNKSVFTIGILEKQDVIEQSKTLQSLDWIIVRDMKLYDVLSKGYEEKTICLKNENAFLELSRAVANHHMFLKKRGINESLIIPGHRIVKEIQ